MLVALLSQPPDQFKIAKKRCNLSNQKDLDKILNTLLSDYSSNEIVSVDETHTDIFDNLAVESEASKTEQRYVVLDDDTNDKAEYFVAEKKVKGKVGCSWE
ncbi:hypothetical protein NPIL_72571 [Nephila pilipes]|uniref:Uncharacterized protein n=1 Tax=Nephila pilipes TaxID=299642 RepID=A0A8X6U9P8_NEPPI|nr:hypothetical protein NPIL_72571 [Nephila pilipes]